MALSPIYQLGENGDNRQLNQARNFFHHQTISLYILNILQRDCGFKMIFMVVEWKNHDFLV